MAFSKFGSVSEYVRQVYEVKKDGSFSGTTWLGLGLHLGTLVALVIWLTTPEGNGAGLVLGALAVITLVFNGAPFLSDEYGSGKKENF
jgi:hypothetical protein